MPSRLRHLVDRESYGAVVLTASLPFLFLHERFQPEYGVGLGSTTVDIRVSDVALLVVFVTALVVAVQRGIKRLRPSRGLWLVGAMFLAWMAFETLRPASTGDALFDEHLVSFFKLGEYALLALTVPLLVRRAEDLTIILGGLVLWCAVATGVALLQLLGLDVFAASSSGWRYPSFLGRHDLAALAVLSASVASAGLLVGRRHMPCRSLFAVALIGGAGGLILAGSVAAAASFAAGAVALALGARRRFRPTGRQLLALAAVVIVVSGGVVAVRSAALDDFLQFVGIRHEDSVVGVETYSQRTVLAYIGLRIWQNEPVVGVGWQRSSRPEVFEPYIADARERFPDVVGLAFPAEGREWGVQNLYIQMLADAGLIGLLLLLAVGAAGLVLAWRTVTYAPNPWAAGAGLTVLCALLTLAGEWASLGIVAGIPLQAATCLLLGLAAAGAATVEEETGD
jgi:O-Antigen ligase